MLTKTPGPDKFRLTLGSRAFWLRQMRQWHWISAAICLIGMLLFAFTGITLNHASQIEAKPQVTARSGRVPDDLLREVKSEGAQAKRPLPATLRKWIADQLGVRSTTATPNGRTRSTCRCRARVATPGSAST